VARVVHQGPTIPLNELIEQGPLVEVSFRPHPVDIDGLASEGTAWEPIIHKMMIDTRARVTVVEEIVPQFLSLVPTRYQAIAGVTGDLNCPVYRLGMTIVGRDDDGVGQPIQFSADIVAVPPVANTARPHVGLLGRDFLQYVRFEYDGPRGVYRIVDEQAQRSKR